MYEVATPFRRRLLLGVITLVVVASGCSSGSSDDASPSTTAPRAGSSTTETTTAPAEPTDDADARPPITLETVEAGAAPSDLRSTGRSIAAPVRGAVKLSGSARPGWHDIVRSPPAPVGPKGQTTVGPDGSRTETFPKCPQCGKTTTHPDGSFETEYPDGSTWKGGGPDRPSPTYTDADGTNHIPDSGDGMSVDIPPTTEAPPEPPSDPLSGGAGEPHYLSEDGALITTQLLGEFVLSTGGDGQEVQARTEPWHRSPTAAAITALALGVDDQRVVVHEDGTVVVDGEPAPSGTELEFGFDDGGAIGVWRSSDDGPADVVVVVWPDLSVARITPYDGWLNLALQWSEATGERTGLLGSDDGDPTNDITGRDGSTGTEDDNDDVVRSWQLTDDETLFDYEDGLTTADYVDEDFPADGPDPDLAAGAAACADVAEGFARDACAYDVGLTGVDGWVDGYVTLGATLDGNDSLAAALARVAEITAAAEGSGSDDPDDGPRLGEGITLSDADRAGASDLGTADASADLEAGGSLTFRFTVDVPSTLGALSRNLSCPNEAYEDGQAGYAFFDEDGTVVSGPRLACDDDPDGAEVAPGTYFVKLVGPGAVDIGVNVIPAG